MLDFAVNVRGSAPPEWLRRRLADRLDSLGSYPSAADDLAARTAVAERHGRSPDEVLVLSGAAEGFAMLPKLRPRLAALIHPSFTEPELALRTADVDVVQVVLREPYRLAGAGVPDAADMVVLGNPTNPTSVLHGRDEILALRRPGRVLVVDEAFADAVEHEAESLAGESLPDVLVLRSLTKTWALAGLRCGYVLGPPDVLAALQTGRAHWPLGTLQLEAIAACSEPAAVAESQQLARQIAADRAGMIAALSAAGFAVAEPASGPFVLVQVGDGELMRQRLREYGIAVRRCDTFPGLSSEYIRLAVRDAASVAQLIAAMTQKGLPE